MFDIAGRVVHIAGDHAAPLKAGGQGIRAALATHLQRISKKQKALNPFVSTVSRLFAWRARRDSNPRPFDS